MPENSLFFSSLRSSCLCAVCIEIGRSISESRETEGRGGGGGAILQGVNLDEVETVVGVGFCSFSAVDFSVWN